MRSEIDLNECEYFLKANVDGTEIVLKESEVDLNESKMDLNESEMNLNESEFEWKLRSI